MTHAALPETAGGRILRATSPRLLVVVSIAVVVIIATAAMLSFNSQMLLAASGGIPTPVAWGWPLIVDGTIIVATVGVLILGSRGKGVLSYAWLILAVFGGISIWANGVHAMEMVLTPWTKFAIGAVPAVALLLSTHLLVLMLTAPDVRIEQVVVQRKAAATTPVTAPAETEATIPVPSPEAASIPSVQHDDAPAPQREPVLVKLEPPVSDSPASEREVEEWILEVLHATGEIPSGEAVGRKLGKSRSAGSRFRKALAEREPDVADALGYSAKHELVNA